MQKPCPVFGDKLDSRDVQALCWSDLKEKIRVLRATPPIPSASGRATIVLYGQLESANSPGHSELANVTMQMLVKSQHYQETYVAPNKHEVTGEVTYPFGLTKDDVKSIPIFPTEAGVTTVEVTSQVLDKFFMGHRKQLAEIGLDNSQPPFRWPLVVLIDACSSHGFSQDSDPPILESVKIRAVCDKWRVDLVALPHNTRYICVNMQISCHKMI